MRYPELGKLKDRLYFTVNDLSELLEISLESARVLSTRYTKKGLFIRLKNNFYILEQKWDSLSRLDYLKIANFLQVPSYISFMTALCEYDVTTQVQRNFFESVSLKRSKKILSKGVIFNYYKFKKDYFFDFVKKGDSFLATKEKAFVDAVYLCSLGRYKLDFDSIDVDKLDKKRTSEIIKKFPDKTGTIIRSICKI
ncbi:MAG: hypothetical protein AB1629_05710 [Candidatus Omnitrophota bacterium]